MSKLFYDHLTNFETINVLIHQITENKDEKEELWHIVEHILHHRVLEFILDSLHPHHHDTFIVMYHDAPYDHSILFFLKDKIHSGFDKDLEKYLQKLESELIKEITHS